MTVLIVDVSHIAYAQSHSSRQLNTLVNGKRINTTVQTGIIKNIWRWSDKGNIPTVVCFDRGCPARTKLLSEMGGTYKEGRVKNNMLKWALNDAQRLLERGGVTCLGVDGYEADDLVASAVHSAKQLYPNDRIEVVTGDIDLVPLCDNQVSVYLRSQKGTSFVNGERQKTKYAEITPETYQPLMEARTMFKGLHVPYNTVLLAKLLRGDTSDGIKSPVKKLFPPKKYNILVDDYVERGGSAKFTQRSHDELFDFLTEYVPVEYLGQLELNWLAMCLNYPYEQRASFPPFNFTGFEGAKLALSCSEYRIRLS